MARRPNTQGQADGQSLQVEVEMPPTYDVPVQYANQLVVNYTGFEFYVTVIAAVPEPWRKGEQPSSKMRARVLGRYAFTIQQWGEVAKSIAEQVKNLEAAGAFQRRPWSEPEEER